MTFKYGPYYETAEGIRDIYRLQLAVFSNPAYVAFYIVAMGVILFHLWHGVTSALQSFGINSPTWTPRLTWLGRGLAVLIGLGFAVLPVYTFMIGVRLMILDARTPSGPITDKWDRRKFENKLVNPANRRKYQVIVVGTGLAGASAAASLGELGYNVKAFCIHDSPRRAHSIAAQGGINAAKNYRNDGDSVYRLFYDTIKGGDYRAREANVYRLAQMSVNIIDQCVAQGVPFAREYGGLLDNRSFGGAQVSRTFYARGQTGQQLLLGAYQSLMRQVDAGSVTLLPAARDARSRHDRRQGARHHRPQPGHRRARVAPGRRRAALHRRLRHGVLPVDQRDQLERHRGVARAQARRVLRQPVLHADPSDLHSGQRRSPVEADPDVARACATTAASGCRSSPATRAPPSQIPEAERDYYLERRYPSFGNLVPRDVASRAAKAVLRRRPRRRRVRAVGVSRLRRRHQAAGRGDHQGALRQPVRHVSPHHRRESRIRIRCASTPPSTTRWAGCGSTTT